MRWLTNEHKDNRKKFARCFAVFPVKIGDTWVWLEWFYWSCPTVNLHHQRDSIPCVFADYFIDEPKADSN